MVQCAAPGQPLPKTRVNRVACQQAGTEKPANQNLRCADHQQQIDQLFLGNRPLNELAAFFPNREAVLIAYAERMAQFYPQHRQIQYCECCERHPPELSVVFDWRGVYQTHGMTFLSTLGIAVAALLHHLFHFLLPSKTIVFSTTHGFCHNCFDLMQRRRIISIVLKQLCLALIVLGAMTLAASVVVAVYFLFPHPAITTIATTLAVNAVDGGGANL
jgi:hypothetical protein